MMEENYMNHPMDELQQFCMQFCHEYLEADATRSRRGNLHNPVYHNQGISKRGDLSKALVSSEPYYASTPFIFCTDIAMLKDHPKVRGLAISSWLRFHQLKSITVHMEIPTLSLEQTSKSIDSSAHMITTARVPADKQVRIAFSLNDSPDDAAPENLSLAFPELDQQLQPLPPCHESKESMQVYKQHCKIAEEYHEVKKEIALLEERKKELIARLEQVEKESMDAAQLAKEYAELTEENRTLKLAQTQCVEQLEKLRIQYQKRQGSS